MAFKKISDLPARAALITDEVEVQATAAGSSARVTVDSIRVAEGDINVGTTPFTFSESAGVLQLGSDHLFYDPATATLGMLSNAAAGPVELMAWYDSQQTKWGAFTALGTDFADGFTLRFFNPLDLNFVLNLDHGTATSSVPTSQLYLQRSSTLNAILMCSDDYNGSGKAGGLVDVFAPRDDNSNQMSASMFCDGVNVVLELISDDQNSPAAGYFNVTNGAVTASHGFTGTEQSTPATPLDGKGIVYFKDAGAGKTGLYVMFPDGSEQQLAVEP